MSKHPKIAGSVSPKGERWLAQLPPSMGRRGKVLDTEAEAWTWLREEAARITLGINPNDPGRIPVGALMERWLAAQHSIKETTRNAHRIRTNAYVKTQPIAAMAVGDVRPTDIDAVLATTPKNWERIHTAFTLRMFFQWAEANEYVGNDPYRRSGAKAMLKKLRSTVEDNNTRASVDNVWTPEQFHLFLASEKLADYRDLWAFFAATAVRRGEAVGLLWAGVDISAGHCRVADTITPAGYSDTTKTNGSRPAYFGPVIGTMLTRRQAIATGPWVFKRGGFYGEHLNPSTVTARFNRNAAALGLPPLGGPHGLRRTFSTIAEKAGTLDSLRMKAMGHKPTASAGYNKPTDDEMLAFATQMENILIPSGALD